MKTTIRNFIGGLAFLSALMLALQPATSHAQGTAFTYQGRLDSGSSPANGIFDLQFDIFDSASGGARIAGPLTNAAAAVSNGLFTVTLDFGAGVFTGADRWLEIAARTNGGGAFEVLAPRQQIQSAPYAIQAANALTAAVASSANSVAAANVVGTLSPAQLPASVLTNGTTGVNLTGNFTGAFAGNGTNLTLNPNVALRTGGNTFSGDQALIGARLGVGVAPQAGPLEVWAETETVDQQQTSVSSAGLRTNPWQSFTPAIPGALSAIEVRDGVTFGAWTNTLVIYSGEGPGGTVLSSQTVVRSPGIIGRITLPQPVPLLPGSLYTFQVLGNVRMDYEFSSAYSGGRNDVFSTADYYFRTFLKKAAPGLTVSDAGFVGIGTTNLDRPLVLQSPAGSSEWISFKDANGVTRWHLNRVLDGWNLAQSGVADHRLFLATNGNTGIGLGTPVRSLEVAARAIADGIQVRGNGNATGFYLSQDGTESGVLAVAASSGQYSTAAISNDVVLRAQQKLFVQSGGGAPAITVTTANRVGIGNTSPGDPLVVVNARCDGSSWINASDRNLKENLQPADPQTVLENVLRLPLSLWNYKSQDATIRHLGPMAQDFHAAFGLGADDKHIATVDADGVALAAIQGLNQKLQSETSELRRENAALRAELAELKQLVRTLAARGNGGGQ
jgi:hypothetical protein